MTHTRQALAVAGLAIVTVMPSVQADPYRLRGNIYAESNARAPVGLLTLDADGDLKPWLSAEAVVWFGANHDDELGGEAQALVIAITARDPEGRGVARLGRILVIPGAVRPIHLDGTYVRIHAPREFRIELFGGVPVASPAGSPRAYDWAVGGRISRAIGQWGAAGIAFIERRDHGRLDDREIGVDAGFSATRWLDVTGRASYDLVHPGVSEARLTGSARRGSVRVDVHLSTLSAARILPATSLFSVLGDVASTTAGMSATFRAAPRLDLSAGVMARVYDEVTKGAANARALLRLDDRGRSAFTFELRRDAVPDRAGWTGARAALRWAASQQWSAAAELELVILDHARQLMEDTDPGGRVVWPWGLVAVSWQPSMRWQAAAAVEMSASPEYRFRADSIVRLSLVWEGP